MKQYTSHFQIRAFQIAICVLLLCYIGLKPAAAQQKEKKKPYSFLKGADVSAGVFGQFTHPSANATLRQGTSLSSGALFSLHKSYHWWLGYDVNYGYTRFNEHYETYNGNGQVNKTPFAEVQTNMNEITAAYLVKGPRLPFGLKPYGEGGLGALIFSPTNGVVHAGIETLNISGQTRFAGLYGAGVDMPLIADHLGARFEYRNLWYMAPGFHNGGPLVSNRPTVTQEPVISVYYKF